MKVFQTHIPQFGAKFGITDSNELTFDVLMRLIVYDSYASSYTLQPALEHKTDEVFFRLWDYERLRLLRAKSVVCKQRASQK